MKNMNGETKKRYLILLAAIAIVGIFVLLSSFIIRSNGEVQNEFDFSKPVDEYSQLYVTGENYTLTSEQEEIANVFIEAEKPHNEEPPLTTPEKEESILENESKNEEEDENKPEDGSISTEESEHDNNVNIDNQDQSTNNTESELETNSNTGEVINSGEGDDTSSTPELTNNSSGGGDSQGDGESRENTQENPHRYKLTLSDS